MKINIYDVAEKAGVSIATVSRVINNKGRVSEATKERVRNVIEELGYHPNMFAMGLAKQKTGIIGVLLPDFDNISLPDSYIMEFLNGLQLQFTPYKYNILIINHPKNQASTDKPEYKNLIEGSKIDGLIVYEGMVSGDYLKSVAEKGFPVILIGDENKVEEISHIRLQERLILESGLKYLKEMGHEKVSVFYYRDPILESSKVDFYKTAYEKAGLPFDEDANLINGYYIEDHIRDRIVEHMKKFDSTAYYTDCLSYATLVRDAGYILGRKVPEDLSLMSMEHVVNESMELYPMLTTYLLNGLEVGKTSANIMIELLGENKGAKEVVINPVFNDFKSVRKINN